MDELFIRERIAFLRTSQKISARELSLRLGQSEGYINRIESGKSNPSVQMLGYICEELGVSMSDFYDKENQHPELIKEIIKQAKKLDKKSLESVLSVMKNMSKK